MVAVRVFLRSLVLTLLIILVSSAAALAQQTGSITGQVSDTSKGVLPGVTVEARSDVLPGPRVTTTDAVGRYQLPQLPPGDYTVTFTLSGMQTATKKVRVQLAETMTADATLGLASVAESVTVTGEVTVVDKTSASITSGLSGERVNQLPVGTQYRDLINL